MVGVWGFRVLRFKGFRSRGLGSKGLGVWLLGVCRFWVLGLEGLYGNMDGLLKDS